MTSTRVTAANSCVLEAELVAGYMYSASPQSASPEIDSWVQLHEEELEQSFTVKVRVFETVFVVG